jgi:hypothetical protein
MFGRYARFRKEVVEKALQLLEKRRRAKDENEELDSLLKKLSL